MDRRPATDRSPALHQDASQEVDAVDDRDEVREEIRATLAALMPWGVSIVAHVVLIALAFFLVWQTIDQKEQQVVVPTLINPTITNQRVEPVTEPQPSQQSGGAMMRPQVTPSETREPTDLGFTQAVHAEFLPVVGTGDGRFPGDDRGDGPGDGLYGHDGPAANRVVFLIDASGSMVDVLPFVIDELKRVVDGMEPHQRGTIIFFSGEGVFEVPGAEQLRGLRPLTRQFVGQINQWVSLENHRFETGGPGSRHVRAALTRALSYEPQAIHLLSDNLTGGGQGATRHELVQEDLISLIHGLNNGPLSARIHTYQFIYQDPLVRAGLQGTLQRIAEETGGEYTYISPDRLMLR